MAFALIFNAMSVNMHPGPYRAATNRLSDMSEPRPGETSGKYLGRLID